MPYNRRYGRKKFQRQRRYRRKPTFTRSLMQGASTATKAYAMAKSAVSAAWKLKGIINSERKKIDTIGSATNIDSAGQLLLSPMAIAQGDTLSQRQGNSILSKFLSVKGRFVLGTTILSATVSLFVVQDNQQQSDTAPAFSDIFDSNFGYSLLNKNTVGRYTLLHSSVHDLNGQGVSTDVFKSFSLDIPLNHHVKYNGTAATDIQKGGIYVFATSSLPTGAAAKPQVVSWCRTTYYDN